MKYEVSTDANDILIKKGSTSVLVILVSKKMAYLIRRKNYQFADTTALRSFFSELEDDLDTGVRWLPKIFKGVDGMKMLARILGQLSVIKPLLDRDLLITPNSMSYQYYCTDEIIANISVFTDIAAVLAEFVDKDFIGTITGNIMFDKTMGAKKAGIGIYTAVDKTRMNKAKNILMNFRTFYAFYSAFGYSGGRGIIRAIMQDDTMIDVFQRLGELVPNNQNRYGLKWERIANYLTRERIAQGYEADEERFINDWADSLRMSYNMHYKNVDGVELHKVPKNDKYPKNLASLHQNLSVVASQYHNHNENSLYAARKMELPLYEYTTKDKMYTFRLPDSDADMIEEARQQHNCLVKANYTTSHAQGETTIVFMRYTKTPDISLVTIERQGDRIIQKYRARNQPVSLEEELAINEWVKASNQARLVEFKVKEELKKRSNDKDTAETTA